MLIIRKKLQSYRARPSSEKALLLEALIVLAMTRFLILILPFRTIARLTSLSSGDPNGEATSPQIESSARIGEAVSLMARHTVWKSACLCQALAAVCMLQRRGIPGSMYLGVAKKPGKSSMIAHAWSTCGSAPVTGVFEIETYSVLAHYSWK